MDDPRSLIKQMEPPWTVSGIDTIRDGGTVAFEITGHNGVTLTATLITPFKGTPRRLTLGTGIFEPPNLVRIRRFALTPGGPTEAIVFDILSAWTRNNRVWPDSLRQIEVVLTELKSRLGTAQTDELEELPEQRVRTFIG